MESPNLCRRNSNMMKLPALDFKDSDRIGRITAVDTSRCMISVEDHSLLTRSGVGNLIAIRGATQQEYLIGMVERVTRAVTDEFRVDERDEQGTVPLESRPEDVMRVVLVGTFRTVDGDKSNTFKRGADSFPQIDRDCFLISAGNLQNFMNLLTGEVREEQRLNLGHFVMDRSAAAILHGDKFFQRHASILGSTGSGKSWAVALILERASKLAHPNIIVFDLHGEYAPLAGTGGYAQGFRIAGPGDLEMPSGDTLFLPYWLLNRDEMVSMLIDRSDQNAPNQVSRFTSHVRDLKAATLNAEGKTDVLATFTVDSPVPYKLQDLIGLLDKDDTERVATERTGGRAGDWNGRLTRFIGRLRAKLEDRRYGFMFQPPAKSFDYNWLNEQLLRLLGSSDEDKGGIKILDFSEVPSDVLPVVVGVLARLLYNVQFWMDPSKRTPLTLVCDEAHLYLPVRDDADAVSRRALESFERIAKEGRKYGVSLVVVSQRPADVSKTILSQCNNFLVMRLTNSDDQNVVRRLVPESMVGLTDLLPLLDTGEALLLGDAVLLPARMKLHPPALPLLVRRGISGKSGVPRRRIRRLLAKLLKTYVSKPGAGRSDDVSHSKFVMGTKLNFNWTELIAV
jgi:hypothetical protein